MTFETTTGWAIGSARQDDKPASALHLLEEAVDSRWFCRHYSELAFVLDDIILGEVPSMITNKPEERPVSPTQNVVVVVDVQLQRFGACEASEVITFEPKVEAHERMPHVVEHTTVVDEVLQQPACSLFWT